MACFWHLLEILENEFRWCVMNTIIGSRSSFPFCINSRKKNNCLRVATRKQLWSLTYHIKIIKIITSTQAGGYIDARTNFGFANQWLSWSWRLGLAGYVSSGYVTDATIVIMMTPILIQVLILFSSRLWDLSLSRNSQLQLPATAVSQQPLRWSTDILKWCRPALTPRRHYSVLTSF